MQCAIAGGDDFIDLAGQVNTDPGQFRQWFATRDDLRQIDGQRPQRSRSVTVSPDPERVGILQLEQVGNIIENRGNLVIRGALAER
ncbi:hypothetical protein D3C76_871670 [compost metagenome]